MLSYATIICSSLAIPYWVHVLSETISQKRPLFVRDVDVAAPAPTFDNTGVASAPAQVANCNPAYLRTTRARADTETL